LWNGIQLCLGDYGVKTYKGFLVCVLADTPAAQLLGGFKEGVGCAVSPCRSCDARQSDMAAIFTTAHCSMRDPEEHVNRIAHLSCQNRKGHKYWSKRWGITGPSVLAGIPGFDVTKCILHDPMHVILEGVAKVELKKMLNIFLFEKKYLTLECLNRCIQQYNFSKAESKDKPEVIDKKALEPGSVFPQTAACMKNLLINLPFIIGDHIPEDDEFWQNFIILLQILLLSITPVISLNTADTLEALVAKHNKNYVSLYSEESLTPKFHYLVHFSQQMRLFGPLRNHWCMRFESKNGFFKLQRWFNFINIPKSLSYYHQRWMCMQMTQSSGRRSNVYLYAGDDVKNGPVCTVDSLFPLKEFLENSCAEVVLPQYVLCSPCVTVNGLSYEKGTVLLRSLAEGIELIEIEAVAVHEQVKYLVCHKLHVTQFSSHRNAFAVEKTDNTCILRVTDLQYPWPQVVHNEYVMLQNADDVWIL